MIDKQQVTINGHLARTGEQVSDTDQVQVGGKTVTKPTEPILYAYNKPKGVTCTNRDPHAIRTLPQALAGLIDTERHLAYAGRLDTDSEGLLLLTNDGDLIKAMMSPQGYHEKEYYVEVDQDLTKAFLTAMSNGIRIEPTRDKTRKCQITPKSSRSFHIILTEGRNRQIRRMCEACDYHVTLLRRIRILNIALNNLPIGAIRRVPKEEWAPLQEIIKRSDSRTAYQREKHTHSTKDSCKTVKNTQK
jgi:23S rRNA pseudouridine2604 synthase